MRMRKILHIVLTFFIVSVIYLGFISANSDNEGNNGQETEQINELLANEPEDFTNPTATNSDASNTTAKLRDTAPKPLPRKYDIKLNILSQYPELPSACESVSLTMLLNYYGFNITKMDLVDKYLVYSSDYVTGYCGNPYSSYVGGGCYAPGMVSTANSFLATQNTKLRASDITGTDFSELLKYISSGTPILLWSTISLQPCEKSYDLATTYNGQTYNWDYMEHCVVLAGYDLDKKTVTVYDPIDGIVTRDYNTFEDIYNQMYKMSVILKDH